MPHGEPLGVRRTVNESRDLLKQPSGVVIVSGQGGHRPSEQFEDTACCWQHLLRQLGHHLRSHDARV
jgi:hypothetical protein